MFRFEARVVSSLTALLVTAAALSAWDCLPDLAIAPPSSEDAGAPASCGDGTIDPGAGEECDPGDAASVGCAGCKVQCGGGSAVWLVDPVTHHCYFSAGTTTALDADDASAEPQCAALSAHVVRFVSAAETRLVATLQGTSNDLWVGLTRAGAEEYAPVPSASIEPGWSPTCTGCYAEVEAGATSLPGPSGYGCVYAQYGFTSAWSTSACAGGAKFGRETICEREPAGSRASSCGDAVCFTVAATAGKKRYVLVPSHVAAADAPAACSAYGGVLAVFGSREEREQVAYEVASQVAASPVADYWMGLSNVGGRWTWDGDAQAIDPSDVLAEGQTDAGVDGGRAFALIAAGAVDSELARADLDAGAHAPLCEITY